MVGDESGRRLRLAACLACWLVVSGCVTGRSIRLDATSRTTALLPLEVEEGPATLELDGATVPDAGGLRIEGDSLTWKGADGGRHGIHTAHVRAIEIRKRGRGLLEGVLGGAAVALLAGGVTALCCEGPPGSYLPREYVVGVGTAILTVPLGALIGGVRGHRVVYEVR